MSDFQLHRLSGEQARVFTHALAELRLKVFWDYPYLYEGDVDYEKKYLETYFRSTNSFIFLLEHKGKIIGATTGIWAQDESDEFRDPYVKHGIDPKDVFYFGESVLLSEFRGFGFGKLFFEEREKFARSLGFIRYLSFCAVTREENHPQKPEGYRPLDEFWKSQGFSLVPNLTTKYSWKDRGTVASTPKKMQYWLKSI